MTDRNKSIVVVLGMHRSGTSAITRGLQVMGVGLGDSLLPPVCGINDKGFWEDIDLNALNIGMLKAVHTDWYHLEPILPCDVEILHEKGYFFRAVELLRQKVSSVPVFGFKDPRVAKLLPFWKEVFDYCQLDVCYVMTLRHPLSVAKSLAKRDGIKAEQSYLLWLGHVITGLTFSAGDKQVLVDYDRLMQSPDRESIRVAKCTGLVIDSVELQSYKSEFLDQGLRHTVYDLNDLLIDDACPQLVREMYSVLLDVASDKMNLDGSELQNKIIRWSEEFERLKVPLMLADKLIVENAVAFNMLSERDSQIVSLNQTLAERDSQIVILNQTLTERDSQIMEVRRSTSWKVTKPIRLVKELLYRI